MTWDYEETELGIEKNISGLICYALGWITGIIFLFIEKNRFVKFHAWQSIIVFGSITVLQIFLKFLAVIFGFLSLALGGFALVFVSIFSFISTVIWIGTFILWIILMVKAYQGEEYKVPLAGDLAEKYS